MTTRRNVVLRGADVEALRGEPFSLDTGSGAVLFRGYRPANPCAWMDHEIAPGAFRAMRGRGGVRATRSPTVCSPSAPRCSARPAPCRST